MGKIKVIDGFSYSRESFEGYEFRGRFTFTVTNDDGKNVCFRKVDIYTDNTDSHSVIKVVNLLKSKNVLYATIDSWNSKEEDDAISDLIDGLFKEPEEEVEELPMRTWEYNNSTNTIWTSFDYGTVQARTYEEAREKALEQLKYDFKKANDAFEHCENTKGFTIEFNPNDLEVRELN